MSDDLTGFIASYQSGARANRFKVIINWPTVVGSPNVSDEFIVTGAAMPASILGVINVMFKGRPIPVPGDRTYEPVTFTFLNDLSHSHRNVLERWHDLMLAHENNVQGTFSYKDLVTTVEVIQMDRNENNIKRVKLVNAWPSNVSEIALDYNTVDQVETFTATFNYAYIESPDVPTT